MPTTITGGSEFSLNAPLRRDHTNDQFADGVIALPDGGFRAVFSSARYVLTQRFDANGAKVGGEVVAIVGDIHHNLGVSAAGLPDGGFVLAWSELGVGRFGQLFNADGGNVGGPFSLTSPDGGDDWPVVKGLANGGFLVTWPNWARVFDSAGANTGEIRFSASASYERAGFTQLADGGYLFGWGNTVKIYNADLSLRKASTLTVNLGPEPEIVQLEGGNLVAVSTLWGTGVVVLRPDGVVISWLTLGDADDKYAKVVATANGGFLVTWTEVTNVTGGDPFVNASVSEIRAQLFDSVGGKIGGEILVNTFTEGRQEYPEAAALTDGRVILIWDDSNFERPGEFPTVNYGVRGRVFTIESGFFTDEADIVNFNALSTAQRAKLEGADIYNARPGTDSVTLPDTGNYQLTPTVTWNPSNFFDAGNGNDMIQGGNGADRIRGGTGRDRIFSGGGADTLIDDLTDDSGTPLVDAGLINGGSELDELTLNGPAMTAIFVGDRQVWAPGQTVIAADPVEPLRVVAGAASIIVVNVETINGVGLLRPLFTTLQNVVDFTALDDAQIAAIGHVGMSYDALAGDDIVILPATTALAGGATWEPANPFKGGAGVDIIRGRGLDDIIEGGSEGDTLEGGAGNDMLRGDDGDDILEAHLGDGASDWDQLTGGANADTFLVNDRDHVAAFAAEDRVVDFYTSHASDRVLMIGGGATQLRLYNGDYTAFDLVTIDAGVNLDHLTYLPTRDLKVTFDLDPTRTPLTFAYAVHQSPVEASTVGKIVDLALEAACKRIIDLIDDKVLDAIQEWFIDKIADEAGESAGEAARLFLKRFNLVLTIGDAILNVRDVYIDYTAGKYLRTNPVTGQLENDNLTFARDLGGAISGLILPGGADTFKAGTDIAVELTWLFLTSISDKYRQADEALRNAPGKNPTSADDFIESDGRPGYQLEDGDDVLIESPPVGGGPAIISPGAAGIAAAIGDAQNHDGGSGVDTIVYAVADAVFVDLAAGTASGASIGSDTLAGFENAVGGAGADQLRGTAAANELNGNGGNDLIDGRGGNDRLHGGEGNDTLIIGIGADSAFGNAGNDGILALGNFDATDHLRGGDGVDSVILQGSYAGVAMGSLDEIEVLLLASGSDTRFGDTSGSAYSYDLINKDANIAAGAVFTIQANGLGITEHLTYDGSAELDGQLRIFAGRGTDDLKGGGGRDGFFFGPDGNLTGADRIDGGANTDSVALRGNYVGATAVVLQDMSLTAIEVVTFLSGHSREFGGFLDLNGFDYDLTLANGNIAAGARLDIIATNLRANENVRLDGRAEIDGALRILSGAGDDQLYGGAGADTLFGGLGADRLEGGAGADIYLFRATGESTAGARDTVHGFASGDKIDLAAIDAVAGTSATNEAFTFIGGSAFSGVAGQLRAFASGADIVIEADTNGDSVADLSILVVAAPIAAVDLVL